MTSHKHLLPLLVLLGVLLAVAPLGFAQAPPPPLNFGNNFFVTGDYIVAGAYGMNTNSTTLNGVTYTTGTISVPDTNNSQGIQGATSVPAGAEIVAALLYWQAVEKVAAPGSGQNGYFGPLNGGPAGLGYAMSGTNISGSNTVSWSSGGCGGGSTGKLVRTYRADVGGALPLVNGNPTANTTFKVSLPSVGNATPLTLGATLVVIYRIPAGANGPDIPLNSIVIYDGDYAQGNAQLTMTQQLQGFYDADHNPVSRLTHIVGSGQSNKFQTVYLGSGGNAPVALPSLYGNGQPAFPGHYGMWDNPTWTFANPSIDPPNPGVMEDASSATTQVVPSSSNQGCVSWGAIIVSTTVKNSDKDGILDSWKTNQGYCDASVNNGSCSGLGDPAWVDLTGASTSHKDIFLQYDYMCSSVSGGSCAAASYSFDPRLASDSADHKTAVDKVVDAFANHGITLHAIAGNAIAEGQSAVTCSETKQTGITCPFPNEPGTVGFREGLTYIKNQNIDPASGLLCQPGTNNCGPVPVFQHGKKDSYHYALFSHGVGLPSWFLSDPTTLTSVVQSGTTVTFTTPTPHGILPIPGDTLCSSPGLGRVTVIFAISNPSLNGTYCVQSVTTVSPYTFTIKVSGSASATYNSMTDPNLAVANGQVTSMSGFSDVGGQNSVISLGYGGWGPPTNDGNTWQVKAGTFMHELGHTLGLTHGGTFYTGNLSNPNPANNNYTPTFEPNCKPNVQTSMSYLFQVDLLETNQLNSLGQPLMVVDYSKEPLPTLTESSPQGPGALNNTAYANTSWYQLSSFAGGTPVTAHCDGTPRGANESYSYVSDSVSNFGWSIATGEDINFNGSTDVLNGHDEWDGTVLAGVAPSPGVDLQQISAVGTITTIGLGGEAGALKPAGGGGALHPAGGGGALKPAGGGGALKPAGGGGLNGDITHDTANSYARPPRNLTAQEGVSPRLINLSWFAPTFGQPVYNIYRSIAGGAFTKLTSVSGQTTFQDTVTCNPGGYSYKVTAVINNDAGQSLESVPSNTVPATGQIPPPDPLTGCYLVPSFSSPASGTKNSSVPITWTLSDDFYPTAGSVTRPAANTLVAIGLLPKSCKTVGRIPLLTNGIPQSGAGTFANSGNNFTFTWNTSGACSGSYTFELDLDSGQKQTTTTPLVLK